MRSASVEIGGIRKIFRWWILGFSAPWTKASHESQTTGPWTSHQYPQHLKNGFTSDEESLESFETDSCFNSLVLPPMDTSGLKTPPEFNVDSERWSQWADAEFNERFEATF